MGIIFAISTNYAALMNMVLSHTTALWIHRNNAMKDRLRHAANLDQMLRDDKLAFALRETFRILELEKGESIDILFKDKQSRSRVKGVRPHFSKQQWHMADFERLGENIYVASPELTLVQCALALGGEDTPELFATICEFCGCYRLPSGPSGGMIKAKRLTSLESIAAALLRYKGRPGAQAVEKALPHCFDSSFSPRETALALILTLPASQGGFGLPKPLLNHPVQTPGLREATELKPDLLWPDASLAVEFESDQFHAGQRYGHDSWRRTVLNNQGLDVITVTSLQMSNLEYLDQVACNIARHLGARIRLRAKKYPERHRALCSVLLQQYRPSHMAPDVSASQQGSDRSRRHAS